jgi:hypothetical protein
VFRAANTQGPANNNSMNAWTARLHEELAGESVPNSNSSLAARQFVRISHQQRPKRQESLAGAGLVYLVRAPLFPPDEKCKLVRMIVRVAVQLLEVFAGQFIFRIDLQGAFEM